MQKYTIKNKIEGILDKNKHLKNFAKYIYNKVHTNNIPYDRAELINKKAISWLKDHKTNFFLWIHYMDVHFPYKPPKKFQLYIRSKPMNNLEMSILNDKLIKDDKLTKSSEMSEDDTKNIIDLYNGEIRYVDNEIKSLIDELRDMDILNDTLIVITADHGEQFWEHGEFGHGANLFDELIRVPLIIYNSEYKNIEIDEPVSLLDVSPTILDLLDISDNKTFQGTSLIPIIKGNKKSSGVISETFGKGKQKISYRTKKWKYILDEGDGQAQLYDLEADPNEEDNIVEKETERAKEFELKIIEHISKQKNSIKGLTDKKEKTRKIIKDLRKLGKI
jgi:arylsulfatase A-like enzyme